MTDEQIAALINDLSFEAADTVCEYAAKFEKREDYRPLEDLAERVQSRIVRAGCAQWKATA